MVNITSELTGMQGISAKMEFDKKSSWISFTVQALLDTDGRLT